MRRRSNISPSKSEIADAAAGDETPLPAPLVPAEVASRTASAGALPDTAALLDVIARAARDPEVNVEKMQQLFALKERIDAGAAQRAFNAALALAKGEIGPIIKTKEVDFTSAKGRTNYRYEPFSEVAKAVDPVFQRHGLSYRFRSSQDGSKVKVTCVLSHAGGHSEEVSLTGVEDQTGNKNAVQAIGSIVTYLQRYSLKLALGLAAADRDDDAAIASEPPFIMTADEIIYVEDLLRDTKSNLSRFLETIGAPSIAEFSADQYKRSVALLNEKKRREAAK